MSVHFVLNFQVVTFGYVMFGCTLPPFCNIWIMDADVWMLEVLGSAHFSENVISFTLCVFSVYLVLLEEIKVVVHVIHNKKKLMLLYKE